MRSTWIYKEAFDCAIVGSMEQKKVKRSKLTHAPLRPWVARHRSTKKIQGGRWLPRDPSTIENLEPDQLSNDCMRGW